MAVYNNLPAEKAERLTLLWENPSPSSSLASGFKTALSDPTVYNHYRVVWQMTTAVDGNEFQIDYTRQAGTSGIDGLTWTWSLAATIRAGGSQAYTRRINIDSTTQFWIGTADVNAGSGTNNTYVIPLRIYGIK